MKAMRNTIQVGFNLELDAAQLKSAYQMYLKSIYPKAKPGTIRTYCSDAFFIYNQLPLDWVLDYISNPKNDNENRLRLRTLIRNDITATRSHPDKDASSYNKSFWNFIGFLRMAAVLFESRLALPRRIEV